MEEVSRPLFSALESTASTRSSREPWSEWSMLRRAWSCGSSGVPSATQALECPFAIVTRPKVVKSRQKPSPRVHRGIRLLHLGHMVFLCLSQHGEHLSHNPLKFCFSLSVHLAALSFAPSGGWRVMCLSRWDSPSDLPTPCLYEDQQPQS